jgi:hypothetical protein
MSRTSEATWRLVDTADNVLMANPAGPGAIAVPQSMTIAVDGLDRPLLLDFAWDSRSDGVVLVGLRGEWDGERPLGLPSRITRSVAPRRLVAQVLRKAARRIKFTGTDSDWGFEDVGPVATWVADALARGRDKSQQSVRMKRARARQIYAEVTAEGSWPDVFAEVAKRMDVGRTSVYTYLRDAGVVGKGKRS